MEAGGTRESPLCVCWIKEAQQALHVIGLSEEEYAATSKKWLLNALAYPHTAKLMAETQRAGVSSSEVRRKLQVDKSTTTRWISGDFPPTLGNFVGLSLLVLRRDLHQVEFPKRASAMLDATRRTISQIRGELLGLPQRKDPLPATDEIACVQLYVWNLLSEQESSPQHRIDRQLAQRLRRGIRTKLAQRFPHTSIVTDELIQVTLETWRVPYVLFELSLIPGWEFPSGE